MRSTLFARRRLLAALGSWPWAVTAQAAGLSLGVVPNLSARVLATLYQPMRSWLADGLRRPVQVLTAAEFATFHERALAGQYELFVTVPNLGALAVADNLARANTILIDMNRDSRNDARRITVSSASQEPR